MRYAAHIDKAQPAIVDALRKMGYGVALKHDDIIVGAYGQNLWYEIKTPTKTGKIAYAGNGQRTKSKQEKLRDTWPGHYRIVTTLEEILADIADVRDGKRGFGTDCPFEKDPPDVLE